jgi:hypothetical protein
LPSIFGTKVAFLDADEASYMSTTRFILENIGCFSRGDLTLFHTILQNAPEEKCLMLFTVPSDESLLWIVQKSM